MRWLIAEDEADIRNLVAMMCQAWGHTPQTFDNGQKVWDWLDTLEANHANGDAPAAAAAKPAVEPNQAAEAEPPAASQPTVPMPAPELPELVLMDIRMPGKKGNEVAQRMRSLPQFAHTPIVLMTAYSLSETERKAMMTSDGVDHILNKPLPDFEQLRTILHDLVTRKQSDDSTDPNPS